VTVRIAEMETLIRADVAAGVPLREARRRHGYNGPALRVTPAATR
jgi:hypothetical protein